MKNQYARTRLAGFLTGSVEPVKASGPALADAIR